MSSESKSFWEMIQIADGSSYVLQDPVIKYFQAVLDRLNDKFDFMFIQLESSEWQPHL